MTPEFTSCGKVCLAGGQFTALEKDMFDDNAQNTSLCMHDSPGLREVMHNHVFCQVMLLTIALYIAWCTVTLVQQLINVLGNYEIFRGEQYHYLAMLMFVSVQLTENPNANPRLRRPCNLKQVTIDNKVL